MAHPQGIPTFELLMHAKMIAGPLDGATLSILTDDDNRVLGVMISGHFYRRIDGDGKASARYEHADPLLCPLCQSLFIPAHDQHGEQLRACKHCRIAFRRPIPITGPTAPTS
jgi:hypothetical protein